MSLKSFEVENTAFKHRVTLAVVAALQNFLGGGLIFGWTGIAGSLLVAPPSNGGAGMTMEETAFIFSVATCINYASPLLLGIILDRHGPRKSSVLANSLVCLGCLVFAMGNRGSSQYCLLGAAMMAFGGPGVQNSCVHVANLFPDDQCLILSCITGTMSLSLSIFPLFEVAWQTFGISVHDMFTMYGFLLMVSAIVSIFLWPDDPYEISDVLTRRDENESVKFTTEQRRNARNQASCQSVSSSQTDTVSPPGSREISNNGYGSLLADGSVLLESIRGNFSPNLLETEDESQFYLGDSSFTDQVTSSVFLKICAIFLVTSFWANFYVGSLATELGDMNIFSVSEQEALARSFTFITSLGIWTAPLVGMLLDRIGFQLTAIVMLSFGAAQMCLLLTAPSTATMLVSFICYSLFRAFLFRFFFAYLIVKMGLQYFGKLSGLAFALSGFAQLFDGYVMHWVRGTCHKFSSDKSMQSGAMRICDDGRWKELHIMQLLMLLICVSCTFCEMKMEHIRKKHPPGSFHFFRLLSRKFGSGDNIGRGDVNRIVSDAADIT